MISIREHSSEYVRYPYAMVHFSCHCINVAFWASLIIVCGLIKVPLAKTPYVLPINQLITFFFEQFAKYSVALLNQFNDIEWQINIKGNVSKEQWYLLISNHLSWADILILTNFARERIPTPKFFLKKELLFVPFVGLSAWAMDMPFMQRYSRHYLAKHPEKRGQDIETTRKACEKFKSTPTTIINFVEGTRGTEQKRQATDSPYRHLLSPKAGGIAFAMHAIPALTQNVIDVTIVYPYNNEPMPDAIKGKLKAVAIDIEVTKVPESINNDYFACQHARSQFQHWLNMQWQRKDQKIARLKQRFQ